MFWLSSKEGQIVTSTSISNIHSGAAMPSWMCEREGRIVGFVGLTASGTLLPQWPQGDWWAARNVLTGQAITSVLGDVLQCQNCLEALGLGMVSTLLTRLKKGYSLTFEKTASISTDTIGSVGCSG
jgi:hypothetical protein